MSVTSLSLKCGGKAVDAAHHLVSLDVGLEVNRIGWACLEFKDGDVGTRSFPISDDDAFVPGIEVEVLARIEGETQDTTLFKGLVVKQLLEMNQDGGLVRVMLKDAAYKLTRLRRSRLFEKKSDADMMTDLLGGLLSGSIPATKPVHEMFVQHACSDWDFLLARAELHGFLVAVENGQVRLSPPQISGEAKHEFKPGLDRSLNFEFAVNGGDQVGLVESIGWDLSTGKPTDPFKAEQGAKVVAGNLDGGDLGKALGADKLILTHPVNISKEELQAWANGDLSRRRLGMVQGRVSLPGKAGFQLLDVAELSGVGERFNGKTLITGIRHRIDTQWRTDVQFGISPQRVGRQFDQADLPASGLLPPIHGLQLGVVESLADDPNKQFRMKVKLPGIDAKKSSVWARTAFPYAGKDHGHIFWPEPGTEVVVGFLCDDPNHAVVLGGLYSGHQPPPTGFEPQKDNFKKGLLTKKGLFLGLDDEKAILSLKTPAANQIELNDDGKTLTLADQHGNEILMDENGISLKSAKNLLLQAPQGNLQMEGKSVDVK